MNWIGSIENDFLQEANFFAVDGIVRGIFGVPDYDFQHCADTDSHNAQGTLINGLDGPIIECFTARLNAALNSKVLDIALRELEIVKEEFLAFLLGTGIIDFFHPDTDDFCRFLTIASESAGPDFCFIHNITLLSQ
jgi:hypothetical protein